MHRGDPQHGALRHARHRRDDRLHRLRRDFGVSPWVPAARRASGLLFVGLGIKLLTARQV
ncbi:MULTISPECIES: hypothetical protein [Burkholderia]|uniref:hypothetical protein n=1 Tax=Burkholderia TaxID=32008 RepID=UPI001F176543|nr:MULTISPECIES: hypothetical protein [Burkholderia]